MGVASKPAKLTPTPTPTPTPIQEVDDDCVDDPEWNAGYGKTASEACPLSCGTC